MPMKTSPAGLHLIEEFEGFSPTAYQDQGGKWTCGFGHTGPDVRAGMTCTLAEAQDWLAGDLATAEGAVGLVKAALRQCQFDALVSLIFNIGQGNFAQSTVLKKLNS